MPLTTNIFVQKLANLAAFSPDETDALAQASSDLRQIGAGQDIVAEGDMPQTAHAVMEGFACRFKTLPDGKRQILDFVLPGDLCDGHMLFMAAMDHSIGTLSPCKVVGIPRHRVLEMTERPALARALWESGEDRRRARGLAEAAARLFDEASARAPLGKPVADSRDELARWREQLR